jgi:hypothetical protein
MTKFFKQKPKQVKPAEPRSIDELNKVYNDLISKLGVEELKVTISQRNATFYKDQLVQISAEADARQKLDKEKLDKEQSQENK